MGPTRPCDCTNSASLGDDAFNPRAAEPFACGSGIAQTPDNLVIDAVGELAVLCSAKPGGPNYTAAMHFCYGYGH